MKTLSNLTAVASDSAATVQKSSSDLNISQSQKEFWRHARASAAGIYFESSAGGQIFVSHAELWKMVEPHDTKLIMPPKPIATPALQKPKT
jgi:hypothetical protein